MHLAAVQLIANALADSTIGVNAVLDSIPRGDHRRPPNVQVYDETRVGWVSRLELAEEPPEGTALPGLVVVLGGPIGWQSKGRPTRDAPSQTANQITVGLHYLTRETETEVGVTDAILTLRAARGVLNILAQPDFVALRTLYGVRLETLVENQYARLFTPIEDVILAGSLLTTWTARETLPHYTP
ncbi:MAG: hypothetical protein WC700_02160 [Gemmatimonadaceae bacterium]|jgi:hypothetical protein